MNVRPTNSADLPFLAKVVDDTELFPSEMLPDMASGFLSDPNNGDIWLTCEVEGVAAGFCYATPEKLTDGTWNMLAIAVLPSQQGKGLGAAIVTQLEAAVRERGNRILIAETSGAPEFTQTREFYRKNGYSEEARIRDFWSAGNDKIVFWKSVVD